MNFEEILASVLADVMVYGLILLKAVAIFVVGRIVAKFAANIAGKMMARSGMDEMLHTFLRNIIYAVLLAFVVIASIGALGIQTASLVAVVGAAGLAIGLALQGSLANFAAGKPIVAYGFPTAFGMAPPDFTGRTVIDYMDVRSALGVGWGSSGTAAPFAGIGDAGLVLDNQNGDIDQRHHIKNGPVLIDLTSLDSNTTIVPRVSDRSLFYIKSQDSLRQYSDFADFVNDLSLSLDGATTARSMHARGKYDSETNTFTAFKIGVYLLEP